MYYSYVYRLLRIKILFGVILLYPNLLEAQAPSPVQWSVDGNIRYRFEKWDNRNAKSYGSFPTIGKSDDKILLQRIIAGTTLQYNQKITLSAHLQDSRAFGWSLRNEKEPDAFKIHPENNTDSYYIMNPQEEFFEIFDASIRIDSIFQWVSVIAGRQKIAYGDYRVFGPGSWGNTGRWTWDAIRIMADKDKWSGGIWLGGTKINDPKRTYLPFTHTEYFGGGAHGNIHLARFLNADFYLAHKHQGSAEYIRDQHINRNWVGFRLFNPESRLWQYELNSTYEFGKENSERINAYGFSLKLGYQFSEVAWKPCLTIRYTYASGNNLETENEEKFDPVFGAADRYYGWMNLGRNRCN